MTCLPWAHQWGWPRKRGDHNVQVCLKCTATRESKVQFDGPRYVQTQAAKPGRPVYRFAEATR